ncbi:MAG: S49 family peptidase [Candidatus Helarchaeota archaeon]
MRIINNYLNEFLWGILPSALNNLNVKNDIIKSYLTFIDDKKESELSNLSRKENTLILKIKGEIFPRVTEWDKIFGYTGILDLRDELEEELKNNSYDRLILNINSPGGVIIGWLEFINLIKEIKKVGIEVIAFSETYLASLAYTIASAANKIITTPTTIVGSIGIILSIRKNETEYITFKKGDLKGVGESFPLSLKEMKFFDEMITNEYNFMVKTIAENRKKPEKEVRNTESKHGHAYQNKWYVDDFVNRIEELII